MTTGAARDGGPRRASRVLADIAHALDSAEHAAARVTQVLELLARLVPYDRCAVLHPQIPRAPDLFARPEPTDEEREPLVARLASLLRLMSGEPDAHRGAVAAPASSVAAGRAHLAVPLVGFDQVIGVLFVERTGPEAYDEESLSLLAVVAAQLAAYLTTIRLAHEETRAHEFQQLLVGIVSHDLRNPLGVIIGSAGLLLPRVQDSRMGKSVERILANGQRAARIVSDLLDLTRTRLGAGIPIVPKRVDLGELVHELVEEVRIAHPKRRIELDRAPGAVGTWDPDRLAQVVTNLLGNAIQYGPADTPVRVTLRPSGAEVVLAVHNRGSAIPPALLEHIFDPFKRGERTRGAEQGLGLGLYIVQHIVSGHGGRVEARSSEVEGTSFTVTLPRERRA
jgi:signal transduction histidine kinase